MFYVGKGSGDRSKTKSGRNRYWHRIVEKAKGFTSRYVISNCNEELAFLVEIERINQLKKLGFYLSNATDGGEGASGYKPTVEQRAKMSLAQKGSKKGPMKQETKIKLSIAKSGKKYGSRPQEWKENISKGLTGRKRTKEECENISKGKKGSFVSEDHREKIRNSMIGEKNFMWGKTHSDSAREKIRQSRLNARILTCPYCGKSGDSANMTRWHFDNCKLKD